MNVASKQGVTTTVVRRSYICNTIHVQVDVVTQLEERVKQHLSAGQSSSVPQIVKIEVRLRLW